MSSGRYVVVEILCDREGCAATEDDVGMGLRSLRAWARTHGWRCDKTGDWCPVHVASDLA